MLYTDNLCYLTYVYLVYHTVDTIYMLDTVYYTILYYTVLYHYYMIMILYHYISYYSYTYICLDLKRLIYVSCGFDALERDTQ